MLILKKALTIDFYFFGGHFPVCGIKAPQLAELCFLIRQSTVRKHLRCHPRAELETSDERLFFKDRQQLICQLLAASELLFLMFHQSFFQRVVAAHRGGLNIPRGTEQ